MNSELLNQHRVEPVINKDSAQHLFSPRQLQVIRLIGGGMGGKAIPVILGPSPRTIERVRTEIYLLLGVSSYVGLVIRALEFELVDRELLSRWYAPAIKKASTIKDRNLQILQMVANDMKNQQIADYLNVSVKTIEKRVSQIVGELGVHERHQAALIWWLAQPKEDLEQVAEAAFPNSELGPDRETIVGK